MTFWAKLLTVVVFILALIFAAMSAVVFGKREDFRSQLESVKRDYTHDKTVWTQKVEDLTKQRDQAISETGEATAKLNATQLLLNTATAANDRKDADLRAKDIEDQKDKDLNTEQAKALEAIGTEVKTLIADANNLKTENTTLTANLSAEQGRANKLEKENTDLTASLTEKTASLNKAQDTLKLNDEIFTELSRRNVAWRELITQWATLPDIKAKVLKVDTESNFVLIDKGLKEGVKKNYEFTIFRDGEFVAKVNVFDVQDELSAARIVVPKRPIQRGDNAWTRLMSD